MSTEASTGLEHLQHDLDRWGPNLADWPDLERQQAEALCRYSAQAATLLKRQIEFQQRLDRDFPVPALDLQGLDQALTLQLARSAPQPGETQPRQTPAAHGAIASWASKWIDEMAVFFRPALAAGLLMVAGFALGFSLGFSDSPAIANVLGDENKTLAAVAQLVLEDSSTNYYQSYGQTFMQDEFQMQQQEPD